MCLQTEVATTFTLLPTLATELRLNIFRRMTAVQDRLIQVHWSRDFNHPYAKAELVRALALNQESLERRLRSHTCHFSQQSDFEIVLQSILILIYAISLQHVWLTMATLTF